MVRERNVHVGSVVHDDDRAHRQQIGNGRKSLGQRRVDEERPIPGMRHELHDLLREEPRIHGVHDAARAGNAEHQLDVAVAVPGERRHGRARRHAERVESTTDELRTPADLSPGSPIEPGDRAGYDLDRGSELERTAQNQIERERKPLHQALHRLLPSAYRDGASP